MLSIELGMKTLCLLGLLALGALIAFCYHGPTREAAYRVNASAADKAAIEAYQQGRNIFLAHWPMKATEISYWADEPNVKAQCVEGDTWFARGAVSFVALGTPQHRPWLCLFNRKTGEILGYFVGDEADAAEQKLRSGSIASDDDSSAPQDPARKWIYDPAHHRADVGVHGGGYFSPDSTPTPSFVHGMQGTALDQRPHR